ncbi:unannotated protein [freshwater metagenome]|uniref:Unannotated protein n=1 Tax=freshwater metagenome TaxID=449393 RepID=A0A6J7E110_9ZZZZ
MTMNWPLAADKDGRDDVSARRSGTVALQDQVISGCTRRSSQVTAICRGYGETIAKPCSRSSSTVPLIAPGSRVTSASTKASTEPDAKSASRAHAQVLPSHPAGSAPSPPVINLRCGSSMAATMAAVPSVDPSSRTMTSKLSRPSWAKILRTVFAICSASLRAGIKTLTGSFTLDPLKVGDLKNLIFMAVCIATPTAASAPTAANFRITTAVGSKCATTRGLPRCPCRVHPRGRR